MNLLEKDEGLQDALVLPEAATFGLIGCLDWLIGFDRLLVLAHKCVELLKFMLIVFACIPTTQVRVVATIGALLLTTLAYITSSTWEPSYEWLIFMGGMSGLDVTQFHLKRTTDDKYLTAKTGASVEPRK